MNLQERIYVNIVNQLRVARKIQDLRNQLDAAQSEHTMTIGAMNVLSELYKDATGNDLQDEINKNPKWKALVERAREEANGNITPAQVVEAEEAPARELPNLRRVTANKTVPQAEKPVEKVVPAQQAPLVERTRNPVNVVIDDSPPQAPAGIIPSKLGDEDDD